MKGLYTNLKEEWFWLNDLIYTFILKNCLPSAVCCTNIYCDPDRLNKMADQNRINLATLQQRDPYITEILGTAKQVALYIYKDEWVRTFDLQIIICDFIIRFDKLQKCFIFIWYHSASTVSFSFTDWLFLPRINKYPS